MLGSLLLITLRKPRDFDGIPHRLLDSLLLTIPEDAIIDIALEDWAQGTAKELANPERVHGCHHERAREVGLREPWLLIACSTHCSQCVGGELFDECLRLD